MKTYIKTIGILAITASFTMGEDAPKGPKGPKGPRGDRPTPEKIFQKLDADGDGNLTLEEFKASPRAKMNQEKATEIFKKIDGDESGGVSLEEFKAHRPPHPPGKGRKGGKKGGDGADKDAAAE